MRPAEKLTEKLIDTHSLGTEEYCSLIRAREEVRDTLRGAAVRERIRFYGNRVFTRGLIEITPRSEPSWQRGIICTTMQK